MGLVRHAICRQNRDTTCQPGNAAAIRVTLTFHGGFSELDSGEYAFWRHSVPKKDVKGTSVTGFPRCGNHVGVKAYISVQMASHGEQIGCNFGRESGL